MATQRRGDTRAASRRQASSYLSKASEFLQASVASQQVGNNVAATGNAVHAGIVAADAIAAARAGLVWRGEHSQAPAHLESVGGVEGRQAARHLRRLLPLKSRAEYEPDPVTAAQARTAVQAAGRMVAIAERVLAGLEP
jgi:hypothetical protein